MASEMTGETEFIMRVVVFRMLITLQAYITLFLSVAEDEQKCPTSTKVDMWRDVICVEKDGDIAVDAWSHRRVPSARPVVPR